MHAFPPGDIRDAQLRIPPIEVSHVHNVYDLIVCVVKLESETLDCIEKVGTEAMRVFFFVLLLGGNQTVADGHENCIDNLYKGELGARGLQSSWFSV